MNKTKLSPRALNKVAVELYGKQYADCDEATKNAVELEAEGRANGGYDGPVGPDASAQAPKHTPDQTRGWNIGDPIHDDKLGLFEVGLYADDGERLAKVFGYTAKEAVDSAFRFHRAVNCHDALLAAVKANQAYWEKMKIFWINLCLFRN